MAGAGDLDGARGACERAVALDPLLAEAWVNLGRVLEVRSIGLENSPCSCLCHMLLVQCPLCII